LVMVVAVANAADTVAVAAVAAAVVATGAVAAAVAATGAVVIAVVAAVVTAASNHTPTKHLFKAGPASGFSCFSRAAACRQAEARRQAPALHPKPHSMMKSATLK
jgi:hypothetical protein